MPARIKKLSKKKVRWFFAMHLLFALISVCGMYLISYIYSGKSSWILPTVFGLVCYLIIGGRQLFTVIVATFRGD